MPKAAPRFVPIGSRTAVQRKAEADQHRGNSTQRGYDAEWRKIRAQKLAVNPLCECDACKSSHRTTAAEVVDHIRSIAARPDLRLVWSNLRSMSKRCHDQHTARTQGFAQPKKSSYKRDYTI